MEQNSAFDRKRLGLFGAALALVAAILFVNWTGRGSVVQVVMDKAGVSPAAAPAAEENAALEQASMVPGLSAPSRAALRPGAPTGGVPFGEELRASASAERSSDRLLVTGQPDLPEAYSEAFQENAREQPAAKAKTGQLSAVPAASGSAANSRLAEARAVRYGVTSREELMGRGAGPVYNLKGQVPLAEAGYEPDKIREHTRTMVEQSRQQALSDPNLTPEAREKILKGFEQADHKAAQIGQ